MSPGPTAGRTGPSLAMVATGGLGVLVVVAFVVGVAFGRTRDLEPGDRIAVVAVEGAPAGIGVLVGRCADERVRAVELRGGDGTVLWRIESEKGGINRQFVVGAEPPAFFATTSPLGSSLQAPPLEVAVTVDDAVDVESFDPAELDESAAPRAPCSRSDLGLLTIAFAVGATGVVVAYLAMVRRYLRGRPS